MAREKANVAAENKSVPKFSKEQLLKSSKYGNRRDLLTAFLDGNKTYTYAEVDGAIKSFMERKVK